MKLVFLFALIYISLQVSTNCNASAGRNVLEVSSTDCSDATLCKVTCNGKLVLMKINPDDNSLPYETRDAYYRTCAWNLERKEILTDMKMDVPSGRGQIISQFIAKEGRKYRGKLPNTKESPKKNSRASKKSQRSDQNVSTLGKKGKKVPSQKLPGKNFLLHRQTVRENQNLPDLKQSNANHRDKVRGKQNKAQSSNIHRRVVTGKYSDVNVWVPTVETMKDWVDYLIFISNQFTFFQDLCRKTGSIDKAKNLFIRELKRDATKGLYPKYHPKDVNQIKSFVENILKKTVEKFETLYNNPNITCACNDILSAIKVKSQQDKFRDILRKQCGNDLDDITELIKKINEELDNFPLK